MRSFQDTCKTRKRSFISTFSVCMAVPLKLTTQAVQIYTKKVAILLKIVSMLINVNRKIIKNNQIKKSYCLMKINVNFYYLTTPLHP